MDPVDVREERVTTNTGGVPVEGTPAAAPVAPGAAPVAPVPYSPAAVTPATTTSTTRTSVQPVGYRFIQLVWLIAAVVDIILALDFIFRAAAANNTGFAHYIFRLSSYLAAPFNGIFNTTEVKGVSSLHWADVLAVAIYSIAAWIVTKLIRITATPRNTVV